MTMQQAQFDAACALPPPGECDPVRILVVEDDAAHRRLIAERLGHAPFPVEVEYVTTCREAHRRLAVGGYACVLLDHCLPDGTGVDLLRRAEHELITTPVLALTSAADPEVALSEFRGGCVDVLIKEAALRGDDLTEAIWSAVSHARARAAVERSGTSARMLERATRVLGLRSRAPSAEKRRLDGDLSSIREAVLASMPGGVLLIENRSRVIYANPGLRALVCGSDSAELPGWPATTAADLFSPESLARVGEPDGSGGTYEAVVRAADGRDVPVQVAETRVGRQGTLLIITDLTEATAQRRRLQAANQRLEELNEIANRFVDNVSHEFRTPLTVIKGYAELMLAGLAGGLTDEQRRHLSVVLDRTRDLAQMVDDLLDTSKLRSGVLRVDRRAHTVESVIESCRAGLEHKSTLNGVGLTVRIARGLPRVWCDREKVGRVLLNLAVNAIRFSQPGQRVIVWARRSSFRGVLIGVTDRGPGIAEEHLGAIFGRFKQVSDPVQSSTKGFGLGLNIAAELVGLNLGRIDVRSRLGRGSTFTVSLPPADPHEVLRRLFELPPEPGEETIYAAALEADVEGGADDRVILERAREELMITGRPMDLVFEGRRAGTLVLVGRSLEPRRWADRLDGALRSAKRSGPAFGPPTPRIAVRLLNSWRLPDDAARAADSARRLTCEEGDDGASRADC